MFAEAFAPGVWLDLFSVFALALFCGTDADPVAAAVSGGLLSVVEGDAVGACSGGAAFSAELPAGVTALGLAVLALGGGRGGNCTQSPAAVGFGVLESAGDDGFVAACVDCVGVAGEGAATLAAVLATAVLGTEVLAGAAGKFFLAGRAGK